MPPETIALQRDALRERQPGESFPGFVDRVGEARLDAVAAESTPA